MSDLERIRSAEQTVGDLQDALAVLQAGLERAEAVAIAVEEAERMADRLIKLAAGLTALMVLLALLGRKKPGA